ncbi:MAG TPA: ACT domain-containing protein [Prolixibacteraceae bacterium]|nr:ACT domain-containing protein [Prolixibacteraceae bacterium]HPS13221.1 ACT domain-containing protein [Prolixibacteraceae bacterium]
MIIKQLSVFLENKSGRLSEVTTVLGKAGINMTAFSIADTSDFGILRVIVSDPKKALEILKENNFSVRLTDVICLKCANEPGSLSNILEILDNEGVTIEYMYAFSTGDTANIVIRPTNVQKGIEILQKNNIDLLNSNDLYSV